MPVTPCCHSLFQSRRDLYQLLTTCQQRSLEKKHSQIISLSFRIDQCDPLSVFYQLVPSNPFNFYLEKREFEKQESEKQESEKERLDHRDQSGYAIAALGSIAQKNLEGHDRFQSAKAFIQATLANTLTVGETEMPFAGPHFLCSFGFFDRSSIQTAYFPAATVFLPRWQVSQYQNGSGIVTNWLIDPESNLEEITEELWQGIQTIRSIQYRFLSPLLSSTLHAQELFKKRNTSGGHLFKQSVRSALMAIEAQIFHKVVLAQAIDVQSPLPFDLVASLHNLRTLYPDCYVFATSNSRGQTFIGASPERLVWLQNHQLLTDALAGSAPRGRNPCEDAHLANRLLNSSKELHEHQMVIDFITQRLERLGVRSRRSPLRLRQLSNIQHLHTPLQAKVPAEVHLLDVVAELHPTPAVAGVPRAAACQHIRQHEAFERSLYAAPIGWVNARGDGEFAVAIRSALLNGCTARLFAGAGIVAGSDPDRELAEVQLKLQALLSALV